MITLSLVFLLAGNVYSSYMPPGQQQGSFGTDLNGHGKTVSPSLQHAQDIMAFSERVAMPPMSIPAPGSRSPSSLSPDFKNREFSPSRPTSKDGPTSQRSDTSHDAQPQKRSGKLPASGECLSLTISILPCKTFELIDLFFTSSHCYSQELVVGTHTTSLPH